MKFQHCHAELIAQNRADKSYCLGEENPRIKNVNEHIPLYKVD